MIWLDFVDCWRHVCWVSLRSTQPTQLEPIAQHAMADADETAQLRIAKQIKMLTLPGEMGERFNVIGYSRGLDAPLCGFSLNDRSHRL